MQRDDGQPLHQSPALPSRFNPHPVVTHRVTMALWAFSSSLPVFQSTPGGVPPGDCGAGLVDVKCVVSIHTRW